jgi:hypothetical protein
MTDDLIAEQLTHAIDLMKAEITATRSDLSHYQDLANQRLDQLETCKKDHEDRLRQVQDTATQFKVLAGLATGGGLLSLISLLKTLLGP